MAASSIGYTSIKDEQSKVVSSFVAGNDIFGALPIGYEKKSLLVYLTCHIQQYL